MFPSILAAAPTAQSLKLPTQLTDLITYAVYGILMISVVWAIVKVIKGIHALERGEEGKQQIVAGILTPMAVFFVVGAFDLAGMWTAMGIILY